jgi:hypothetical protein
MELTQTEVFSRARYIRIAFLVAVVALAIMDEAYGALSRRGIAPWTPVSEAKKGGSTGTSPPCGDEEAETPWTRVCPCAHRSRSHPVPRMVQARA